MFKALVAIICLALAAASAAAQTFYGTTDIEEFRKGRDKEFRTPAQSPLLGTDFEKFAGLKYFPVDEKYRVTATFERTFDEKYFLMPTSSGDSKKFVKYGIFKFRLGENNYQLSAYQAEEKVRDEFPEYAHLLFIPFRDLTNGKETYGAGRYLDIRIPSWTKVILDFNVAYNPNCAYGSSRYSCPIPPKENRLETEIKAGELKFESTQTAASGGSANKEK